MNNSTAYLICRWVRYCWKCNCLINTSFRLLVCWLVRQSSIGVCLYFCKDRKWHFHAPNGALANIRTHLPLDHHAMHLSTLRRFFFLHLDHSRTFSNLFSRTLSSPPFGIYRGVSPFFVHFRLMSLVQHVFLVVRGYGLSNNTCQTTKKICTYFCTSITRIYMSEYHRRLTLKNNF